MKQLYDTPTMEVIRFSTQDVIQASDTTGEETGGDEVDNLPGDIQEDTGDLG